MAAFEAKTFFNQGHPCFIAAQENPLGPTGAAIRGPLVVLPDSLTNSVTQLLTDASGNTQLANTNIATGVSQTTFNILADGTVNIDNLARPNPIQQWTATETTITAPILLSTISVGGDPFQISQLNQGGIGRVTRMEVLDSANASIEWNELGNLTLNSTMTVLGVGTAGIILKQNPIKTIVLDTRGLSGVTDATVQWQILERDASPSGLTIDANINNGQPPNVIAYQAGNTAINSTFVFTNDPIPKMRVTSLTSPTYLETYSAGLAGQTADGTGWTVRSLNTTGIEINASRNNGQAPAIQANPDGTTKINTGFTFGNSVTNRLTVADSLGNKTTVDPVTLSLGQDPALAGFVLDPTGFTLNSSPLSLRLIQSPNDNAFTLITNNTNTSTMNIFDNRVQVANLQTFPGSLIVSNQTAYETGSSAYGGTQLTWNAVAPGSGNTEIINSYGSSPLGGFNVYSGADGCPKENLSTIMSLNLNYLTTPATVVTPALQTNAMMASTINVSSIQVTGGFVGVFPYPTGGIMPWAGGAWNNTNIPTGFLICDGSYHPQVGYPDLYAVIGQNYATATPTENNFQVPDLSQRALFGAVTNQNDDFLITIICVAETDMWPNGENECIYVSNIPYPSLLCVGMTIRTVMAETYRIVGLLDTDGSRPGLVIVYPPIVTRFQSSAGVVSSKNNNTNCAPASFAGYNRTLQTADQVAAHNHPGAPGGANAYNVSGGNQVIGNPSNTGYNNGLYEYKLQNQVQFNNLNLAMATAPARLHMMYLIKT